MVSKKRGIDLDGVRQIATSLPGVEESTSYGGTAFKVRGKMFACQAVNKSAEPNSLMVRLAVEERDALLATAPETYYLTDHYRGYPCVLVRLSHIGRDALRDLLEDAAQFVSAKKRRPPS